MALTKAKLIADNAVKAVHIDETDTGITLAQLNVTGDITATNVAGNVTGNVTGDLTGTILTAAQPNITSVGTLSSLSVSGNLTVDTDTLFVDAASNNVGIGVTTPAAKLHVQVGAGTTPTLNSNTRAIFQRNFFGGDDCGIALVSGNNASTGSFIDFGDVDDVDDGKIHYATNTRFMAFHTAASERMRINSSGNVGIGTSNPTTKLDIAGPNLDASGDYYSQLKIKGTGTYPNNIAGLSFENAEGQQQHIRFLQNGSPKFQIRYNEGAATTNKLNFYSFITNTDIVTFDGNNGNVGIGTSSPATKLHVNGDISNGNGKMFSYYLKRSYVDITASSVGLSQLNGPLYTKGIVLVYNENSGNSSIINFSYRGGAGIAYLFHLLDPDGGYSATNGVSWTEPSASGGSNAYSFSIASGSGVATLTRTSGSSTYSVYIYVLPIYNV